MIIINFKFITRFQSLVFFILELHILTANNIYSLTFNTNVSTNVTEQGAVTGYLSISAMLIKINTHTIYVKS